jgi:hypothetical protein
MAAYVPPAWPAAVSAPGSEDWESSAAAWLLDLLPEYRGYPQVHRYPVVLASIANHTLRGALAGARDGYRTVRTELGARIPPHAIEATLAAYQAEGRRLAAVVTAIDLVERALRGETFRPRL